MRPLFCFIDDSAFELDVFKNNIVPAAKNIDFTLASTYAETRREIGSRYPALFILDLYGRDPNLPAQGIPAKETLAAEIKSVASLDSIYEGLDDFSKDTVNEFLKRMFHLTDAWRNLFSKVFRATGQNINYGLSNLAAARKDFPSAAAVAYTRKSMISDAVEAFSAGFQGLNLKPDAFSDEEIHRVTTVAAPGLLESWSSLVTKRFTNQLRDMAIKLFWFGLSADAYRLREGKELSFEAHDVLSADDLKFLKAAQDWQTYTGQQLAI
ncbi:MAG: hypothetical protein JRI34_05440 [Deltaproteobacteria bacterium]|nr:hypothetical protein [Deltaproteobacteria bacterium]